MSEESVIQHLKEMEERIMTKIDEVRAEVIERGDQSHGNRRLQKGDNGENQRQLEDHEEQQR